jgi:hypothetical protein
MADNKKPTDTSKFTSEAKVGREIGKAVIKTEKKIEQKRGNSKKN